PECEMEWFRNEFEVADGQPTVGVVAQFIERKGHRTLLQALPPVLETAPDLRVLLFGQGPLREELEAQVRDAGLEGTVRFAGFRNDLERVLPCLDAVAHPAEMEGLGVSLLQAAACAVPIVATPVGGIPEIVREGENGLLVPPGDTDTLAKGLARLLDDSGERREMGRRGRAIAESEFSIDAMVEGNLQVYQRLLEG
ncbi:MAG TPA: glycosyltransferase, partial [Gammaproteobacteria bacterium]|nr:glycosyltransferase [Gammaproteobacteria bacterium]